MKIKEVGKEFPIDFLSFYGPLGTMGIVKYTNDIAESLYE